MQQKAKKSNLLLAFFCGVVLSGISLTVGLLLGFSPQALAQEKTVQVPGELRFPPELIWENRDMKADAVSITVSPNGKELFVAVIDPVEGLRVVHIPTSRVR